MFGLYQGCSCFGHFTIDLFRAGRIAEGATEIGRIWYFPALSEGRVMFGSCSGHVRVELQLRSAPVARTDRAARLSTQT